MAQVGGPKFVPCLSFFLGVILLQATLSPPHPPLATGRWANSPVLGFSNPRRTHRALKEEMGWYHLKTPHQSGFLAVTAIPQGSAHFSCDGFMVQGLPLASTTFSLRSFCPTTIQEGHNLFLSKCRSWPLSDQSQHGAEVCALLCREPTPSVLGHPKSKPRGCQALQEKCSLAIPSPQPVSVSSLPQRVFLLYRLFGATGRPSAKSRGIFYCGELPRCQQSSHVAQW